MDKLKYQVERYEGKVLSSDANGLASWKNNSVSVPLRVVNTILQYFDAASGAWRDVATTGLSAAFYGSGVVYGNATPTLSGPNTVLLKYSNVGTSTFVPPTGVTSVNYLVVAGGGSGANSSTSGGTGGNGGQVYSGTLNVTPLTSYSIIVGAGGAFGASASGQNSQFGSIVAFRGTSPDTSQNGFSPGGKISIGAGGSGATYTANGQSSFLSSTWNGGNGINGVTSNITGTNAVYGSSGGGGVGSSAIAGSAGTNSGIGGKGSNGGNALPNFGGGGGGAGYPTFSGGAGGSGIVIISYDLTF